MSMNIDIRGNMPRRTTIVLLLTALILPACSSSKSEESEVQSALQQADAAREDFIAPSLEMLLAFSDRIAPLCQARSEGELLEIADRLGCSPYPEGDGAYAVLFRGIEAGAQGVSLHARLEFVGEDGSVGPPEAATSMRARIEAAGDFSLVEGELECVDDPWRGIVIQGALATDFLGACTIWTHVEHVTARSVADTAG